MHVIDLSGNEYSLQATSANENGLEGNQYFSATILPTKVNKLFIEDIAEMWNVIDHDDVEHKIIYHKKKGEGNSLRVDIKGIPLFFDVLDNDRIYERIDEHMTANVSFSRIFADTGFEFVIVDQFSAVDWEGFGDGETKLESFKRALDRYKCEFRIVGRTVYLETQIGRDTSIMYRHKLNASNIVKEVDANEMWTYAKGYGDYEDGEDGGWETAKLKREYTSPLADIIGIRHAPPIKDGRVKDQSTMDASLKALVDESLKLAVSATVHDLSKQNYPIGQSQVGDRVFLIDERIGLNEEIRVANQSITRNWKGDIIDININFGSANLSKRHQSNINTAVKNITDVYAGRKKLELSFLDERVQEISNIINGNTDSVFKYMPNGIVGWNGDDPNYMTRYVGDAIGFSKDGGQTYSTAMSAELGIVADYITTGTLRAILIDGVEIYGSSFTSELNPTTYTKIENANIESRGSYTRTWFGETTTHDVGFRVRQGHIRFENFTEDKRLYYSDTGIATFIRGYDDESSNAEYHGSGVIEFFSHMYNPDVRGLTLFSNRGTIGLRTETRDIVLDAAGFVYIPSQNLRTNGIGVREGYTNFYVGASGTNDGELRVTNKLFYNDGEPRYLDVRARNYRGRRFIDTNTDSFLYFGSDLGARVTSKNTNNGSSITYRPLYASNINAVLSEGDLQGAMSSMILKPTKNEALNIINNIDLLRHTNNGLPEFKTLSNSVNAISDGESTDINKSVHYLMKSVQELSNELEGIKSGQST